jgi:hypothetical protein
VGDEALPIWRLLLDKFILPLMVLAVVALASGLYGAHNDINRLEWAVSRLQQDSAEHNAAFERFRNPGDRFTAQEGTRHDIRISKLEDACQRCAESRIDFAGQLKHINDEQDRLCQRVQLCVANGMSGMQGMPGMPSKR